MKKTNFLKFALTLVMAFVMIGAFAQIPANYTANQTENIYQTAGHTFRLYVEPDVNYSPTYATTGTIGTGVQWSWTFVAGLGTASVTSGTPQGNNWVEFVNPTTTGSPFTVTVVESNTAVLCTDAGISQIVNVVAEPKAVITTVDPAAACGLQPAAAVAIQFTEAVPATLAGYAFAVTESVDNLSDLGATPTVTNLSANPAFVNFPITGKLNTGNGLTGAASPYGYSFNTSALNVQGGKITRYTYTLVKATDANAAAGQGLISAINHKSQYVALQTPGAYVNTSSFDGKYTYVAIVVPTPTTGPIYHISNTWAY